jgi:phosphatidyl-myo-inositol dimannoside synthase
MRDSTSQRNDSLQPSLPAGASDGNECLRSGHASLDLVSRDAKARKIERLLGLQPRSRPIRLLEVGTGAGGIAHYFGTHESLRCEVDAVDVQDHRQVRDGYRFTAVGDVRLPFGDRTFDVVISNHVIEHVGGADAQRLHLQELRRVLDTGGLAYLAVPNRWQLVEPHFQLAFLSWLPPSWRSRYVRLRGRGREYDCRPLTTSELERQLRTAGFDFVQEHARALRLTFEIERPRAFVYTHIFRRIPDGVFARLRAVFPTLIYLLRRRGDDPA